VVFEIRCGACGAVIYSGSELRSPRDALKIYSNRCRNCGRLLSLERFRLELSPSF
jgi:DNA-directed RNA polymerase subunit N (RpoN/RPB10)